MAVPAGLVWLARMGISPQLSSPLVTTGYECEMGFDGSTSRDFARGSFPPPCNQRRSFPARDYVGGNGERDQVECQ